jgi:hypothetical protein
MLCVVLGIVANCFYLYQSIYLTSWFIALVFLQRKMQDAVVAFMCHPLLVLSAAMVRNPMYYGQNWYVAGVSPFIFPSF